VKEHPHPPVEEGKASLSFHKTDVVSWAQLSSLWATALELFPRIDIVVPGAGIYDPPSSSFWYPPGVEGGPSRDKADAEIGAYAAFTINLIHPIRLAQVAIGYWTTNKLPGSLLFTGSIAGNVAGIGTPFYYSSKAGLHNFVRSVGGLRQKLRVRVMCIAPSIVRVSGAISPTHFRSTRICFSLTLREFHFIDSVVGVGAQQIPDARDRAYSNGAVGG
jgi:NAD(P)-dependent dehydrogenase (short-subunit alcohol dehydrogenase family)